MLLGAQIGSSSSHDQGIYNTSISVVVVAVYIDVGMCTGKCSEVEEKVIPLKKRKGHLTEEEEDSKKAKSKMKKRFGYEEEKKRGGAIMEGSRCSRVNGRGWRCCQQTLVGYSLCEHHLGKGRLRSITNVKTRALGSSTPVNPPPPPPPLPLPCISNDEKKPLVVSKKRMKLGMVKARSLSSLLGQTKNEITLPEK